MNNSPSNIFQSLLLLERYHENSQAVLAAASNNGLRYLTTEPRSRDASLPRPIKLVQPAGAPPPLRGTSP